MPKLRPVGVRLLEKDEIQMYLFGGKGRFILKSTKTETSYEYRIKRPSKTIRQGYGKPQPNPKYDENILWVTVKVDSVFSFLGTIRIEENDYYHSKKSNINITDKRVKGIQWLLKQFEDDKDFPTEMEFHHMGVCGCCARTLTTPGSIKMGIGPICFERYGSERLKKLLILKKKMEKKLKHKNIIL